ncbi:MAG: hypothetical protein IPI07_12960 [Flavobacteriales bacterium]|nr:hypothetical protein [Flavobacteriales bacterium]
MSTRAWAYLLLFIAVFATAWQLLRYPQDPAPIRVAALVATPYDDRFELFYHAPGAQFGQDRSVSVEVTGHVGPQWVVLQLPDDVGDVAGLRLDPGTLAVPLTLCGMEVRGRFRTARFDAEALETGLIPSQQLEPFKRSEQGLELRCTGGDPYLTANAEFMQQAAVAFDPVRPVLGPVFIASLAGLFSLLLVISIRNLAARRSEVEVTPAASITRITWPRAPFIVAVIAIDLATLLATFGLLLRTHTADALLTLDLRMTVRRNDLFHLFHRHEGTPFSGTASSATRAIGSPRPQWVRLELPTDTIPPFLRLDFGAEQDTVVLHEALFRCGAAMLVIPVDSLVEWASETHEIDTVIHRQWGLVIVPSGRDPFFALERDLSGQLTALRESGSPDRTSLPAAIVVALLVHLAVWRSQRTRRTLGTMRTSDATLAGGFILLLFLPLLALLHPGLDAAQRYTEKRHLAELPALGWKDLDTWPDGVNEWYKDHFGFRSILFRWNAMLHAVVMHTSPLPDRLLMGKDGWMYLTNDKVIGNYHGQKLFTFEELERIRIHYEKRQAWLHARGIPYVLLVPPLKANVYPEHLPDRIHRMGASTWLDEVKEHFARYSTLRIIDMRPALLEGKKEREVYYRTDIHWNPYGAYLGYRVLMDSMRTVLPQLGPTTPIGAFNITLDVNEGADLAQLIALNDVFTRVTPKLVPVRPPRAVPGEAGALPGSAFFHAPAELFTTADTAAPRLLMFHDSFGLYLKPLLAEHFSRSLFVWTGLFIPDIVEHEKPDFVVQEFMEMFIVNMPLDRYNENDALP